MLAERLEIRTDEQAERLYDALLDSPQAELEDVRRRSSTRRPGATSSPCTAR